MTAKTTAQNELRTVLRSKNRLFSTQKMVQLSTQRKRMKNGLLGSMITLGNHWMRPRPSHFFRIAQN